MSRTMFKLRVFGIAAFLLFIISAMFKIQFESNFYFAQGQQILALVAFVIFVILILVHIYKFYINNFANKREDDNL